MEETIESVVNKKMKLRESMLERFSMDEEIVQNIVDLAPLGVLNNIDNFTVNLTASIIYEQSKNLIHPLAYEEIMEYERTRTESNGMDHR
jgi:hypothetical protein